MNISKTFPFHFDHDIDAFVCYLDIVRAFIPKRFLYRVLILDLLNRTCYQANSQVLIGSWVWPSRPLVDVTSFLSFPPPRTPDA